MCLPICQVVSALYVLVPDGIGYSIRCLQGWRRRKSRDASGCANIHDAETDRPEINADHLAVIEAQRKRLGTRRGFIAVKSNCSLQSYVPALHPLKKYGLDKILVCTYQAISGAGKTFQRWPEMVDNCIPYIGGEEEKSEQEPLKLWGRVEDGKIVRADGPSITAQCFRVACQDGHMAAVFMKFADGKAPSMEQIKADWEIGRASCRERV